jgi:hypothetical protein
MVKSTQNSGANILKKATPRTVKKKITKTPGKKGEKSKSSDDMETEATMITPTIMRDNPTQAVLPVNENHTNAPRTNDMEVDTLGVASAKLDATAEETFVRVRTPTSQAFDETFKKLSKHEQVTGFPNYQAATRRMKAAILSLNAIKGYDKDSMESHAASLDPSTWKDIFATVYKKRIPQLSSQETSSLKVLSMELAKTDPFIFPGVRQHPSFSPDEGVLIPHTPHTAMFRGAGELWGHIWHIFPSEAKTPTLQSKQPVNKGMVTNLYQKVSSPPTLKEAPLPPLRSYGELSMMKPCLPFEAEFQT